MESLAEAPPGSAPDMDDARFELLKEQAVLQVAARARPEDKPPFKMFDLEEQGVNGMASLPEPNDGDVFLDFEGHPFFRPDSGTRPRVGSSCSSMLHGVGALRAFSPLEGVQLSAPRS